MEGCRPPAIVDSSRKQRLVAAPLLRAPFHHSRTCRHNAPSSNLHVMLSGTRRGSRCREGGALCFPQYRRVGLREMHVALAKLLARVRVGWGRGRETVTRRLCFGI